MVLVNVLFTSLQAKLYHAAFHRYYKADTDPGMFRTAVRYKIALSNVGSRMPTFGCNEFGMSSRSRLRLPNFTVNIVLTPYEAVFQDPQSQ